MIGPEAFTVERERACSKRDRSEIIHLRTFLFQIQPGDSPFFGFVGLVLILAATQHVDAAIEDSVATNFRADINLTKYVSLGVKLQNPLFVPLTHVEVFAVEANVGAGEIGTCEYFGETPVRHIPIDVTIVVKSL